MSRFTLPFQLPLRPGFALLGAGCAGLVGCGLLLQQMLNLAPCPLCIFQRLLYLLVAVFAMGGLAWPQAQLAWRLAIGATSGLGFGVAAYQSWMQLFPHLATECGYTEPNLIERLVDWLGMQWPGLFLATGFCTSREWEFLGLSMANWSMLVFAGCLAYAWLLGRSSASGNGARA